MHNPNEKQPIVSVIIPSYNHAEYIEDAITSVLNQEPGGYNLDLIVIDDGSTDDSAKIIQQLRLSSSINFKFIQKQNEGVSKTLNRAIIEHADGDYIAILASDDLWASNKIKLQLDCLARHPKCELTYCNATTFGNGFKQGKAQRAQLTGWVKGVLTVYNFIPAGSVMYKRNLFDKIGGYDENGMKLEDWDFILRAANVTPFCRLKEALLYYRIHDNSSIARMRLNGTLFSEKQKVMRKNKDILNPFLRAFSLTLHYFHGKVAKRAAVSKLKVGRL